MSSSSTTGYKNLVSKSVNLGKKLTKERITKTLNMKKIGQMIIWVIVYYDNSKRI